MDTFNNIKYKRFHSNSTDNIKINMEEDCSDNKNQSPLSELSEESSSPLFLSAHNLTTGLIMNTKKDNNKNKYVNGSTLDSYLSINELHRHTQENIDICRDNIKRIDQRDNRINDISSKTDTLVNSSVRFNKTSHNLKHIVIINYIAHIVGILFFVFIIVFLSIKLSH